MSALSRNKLFSVLSDQEILYLSHGARTLTYSKGEHLFCQNDTLNHYYFLESGHIRLYRLGYDGQEKVFRELTAGMVFAETVAFAPGRLAPLNALMVKKSRVTELDSQRLADLYKKNSTLAVTLIAFMAENLSLAVNRIDQLTVNKATQRLVLYLADLYQIQGSRWLILPYSQSILARQLNIEPETLSRLLTKFRRNNLISVDGKECVILDTQALCEEVNLPSDTFESNTSCSDSFRCCGL